MTVWKKQKGPDLYLCDFRGMNIFIIIYFKPPMQDQPACKIPEILTVGFCKQVQAFLCLALCGQD